MCDSTSNRCCCGKPQEEQPKPADCKPEQTEECQGDAEAQPCDAAKPEQKPKGGCCGTG